MIVRLWMESDGLRARVTRTLDAEENEHSVAVGGSADDICDIVRKWVEGFIYTETDADPLSN